MFTTTRINKSLEKLKIEYFRLDKYIFLVVLYLNWDFTNLATV